MISHLKGTVEKVAENAMIIDVNGVGYRVVCSSRTIGAVGNTSSIVHIFTELVVREDAWMLYGFASESERFWFDELTSVQGVGGKAAMAILSVLSDDDIYNAFLAADKDVFTRADGVGPKLASRIVSELKDKVIGKSNVAAFIPSSAQSLSKNLGNDSATASVTNDVISALVNLGYQKTDIYRIISSMKIDDDVKFDTLLRQVLSRISAGR